MQWGPQNMARRVRAAVDQVGRPDAPGQQPSLPADADPHTATTAFRIAYEKTRHEASAPRGDV
ncbi:hypothetical protein ACIO6T_30635 [Streptomyces sp. NPDC087532]|uniref:hypothetical protein n=1 Tax=Streptomyces sp. NPDC087532 TaxID=3365795 RepID=UPI00381CE3A9